MSMHVNPDQAQDLVRSGRELVSSLRAGDESLEGLRPRVMILLTQSEQAIYTDLIGELRFSLFSSINGLSQEDLANRLEEFLSQVEGTVQAYLTSEDRAAAAFRRLL